MLRSVPALFVIVFVLMAGFGWGWNIVKLFSYGGTLATITIIEILRIIGIFVPPLGAVLGYL